MIELILAILGIVFLIELFWRARGFWYLILLGNIILHPLLPLQDSHWTVEGLTQGLTRKR